MGAASFDVVVVDPLANFSFLIWILALLATNLEMPPVKEGLSSYGPEEEKNTE